MTKPEIIMKDWSGLTDDDMERIANSGYEPDSHEKLWFDQDKAYTSLYFMNMYIGNLSYNVRESDLRQVMEEYGTVDSVKLIIDRDTRKSKGFAFVEMPDDAEAANAIKELNGAEYVGRPMVVKEALPKN